MLNWRPCFRSTSFTVIHSNSWNIKCFSTQPFSIRRRCHVPAPTETIVQIKAFLPPVTMQSLPPLWVLLWSVPPACYVPWVRFLWCYLDLPFMDGRLTSCVSWSKLSWGLHCSGVVSCCLMITLTPKRANQLLIILLYLPTWRRRVMQWCAFYYGEVDPGSLCHIPLMFCWSNSSSISQLLTYPGEV